LLFFAVAKENKKLVPQKSNQFCFCQAQEKVVFYYLENKKTAYMISSSQY
jgi:hypothetical protein